MASGILDELRERREEILAVARSRGASHVRVFGSVARGDDGLSSDVDFLVELEPTRTLLAHAGDPAVLAKDPVV
jgi:predicted nucleotidyltransferase